MADDDQAALVRIEGLIREFATGGLLGRHRHMMRAVDGVDLAVPRGETLGIVGESGSGKSTLLRIVLRLLRPTAGRVLVAGQDVWRLDGRALTALRRQMQVVFQDPGASFNPRQSLRQILGAPLEVHGLGDGRARLERIEATLALVGLSPALLDRHPHQLSGGQKQRVAIARAVVLRPSVLLLDEPTSALDVSVQAQVLNLFNRLKRELGLTCLFVSHNLAVIRYVSDRVAVMRQGRVIESGTAEAVFTAPREAYTRELLAAVPDVGQALAQRRGRGAALVPLAEVAEI
jgi:ABC-type glutathione transport system ATPase component